MMFNSRLPIKRKRERQWPKTKRKDENDREGSTVSTYCTSRTTLLHVLEESRDGSDGADVHSGGKVVDSGNDLPELYCQQI